MSANVPLQWLAHLKDEAAKENFKKSLIGSAVVIDRFLDILQQMENELSQKEISEDHFSTPEWQTRQAFYLGQKAKLRSIKDLFKWRTKL